MNPVLLYMLFDPWFWWLAVAPVAPAPAAETDEDARA